ncbi:tRNA (adenosine(37)-N6)-threonylcarbamoyltransferase complex dimerization subunit type 1 TsaB [Hydromonas duriensis]|uniref:tRNA threonylcarbamoyladenosine biosynthesis protein TsaB n=1 Tax=Hydromonas duriensis TaxID=1527608 RepID=A0A4R6Y9S8_9BURK|nr:tRNA (adenosine(37)-N6)-threonylcarbamoyltransferase complex dimerization subunit type 1 TsaB [Hydromonas duriensis]TDR32207.1 tRNA threonylcarbamoyladenosine biosynthesis protein TsaB [Hydromonas duriensis]
MSAALLAIDTSSAYCSVALDVNGQVSTEHSPTEQTHSEHVLPMVRRLLEKQGMGLKNLDAFVVGIGPGGFTGVRLGVAVVQGLAYATGKPVIALSSLLALAQAAFKSRGQAGLVWVANDARMQQMYWAAYYFSDDGQYTVEHAPSLGVLSDLQNFAAGLNAEASVSLAGNAWASFPDVQAWSVAQGYLLADIDHAAPNAVDLLPLAQRCFREQRYQASHDIAPLYVRDKIAQTIAEREAAKLLQEQA